MKLWLNVLLPAMFSFCASGCLTAPEQSAVAELPAEDDEDCKHLSYFAEGETLVSTAYTGAWAEMLCARIYKEGDYYRAATGLVLVTDDGERRISSAENISVEAANMLLASAQARSAVIERRLPKACVLPNGSVVVGGAFKFLKVFSKGEQSRIERFVTKVDAKIVCEEEAGAALIDDVTRSILTLAPLGVGNVCRADPDREICMLAPGFSVDQ